MKDPRWEFVGGCPKAAPTAEGGRDSVAWRPARHGGPIGARRPRVGGCSDYTSLVAPQSGHWGGVVLVDAAGAWFIRLRPWQARSPTHDAALIIPSLLTL